jgi:hypothetical protein
MTHWLRQLHAGEADEPLAPLQQVDPLRAGIRSANYRRQNGSTRLTPRQRRRIRHKLNRAIRRGLA